MKDKLLMRLNSNSSQFYMSTCRSCGEYICGTSDECYECGSFELETDWDSFDEHEWEDAKEYMASLIGDGSFKLIACNSNWRGQDGYAEAKDSNSVVDKAFSFNNDWIELWQEPDNSLFIRTASHDVPMGFIIRIEKG